MHEITIPVPLSLAVECGVFKRAAELGLLTIGGIVVEQPRPLAKVAPVPAPVARPARTRAPRKAAVKPAKRPARKAKPAAPPAAAEPVKAGPRAKKAKVQGVPGNVQNVYDAIVNGASQAGDIRKVVGITRGPLHHAVKALKAGKIPGLRIFQFGEKSKAHYGTSPEQAKARFDAAENPAPDPRKSLAVKPIKRVRKVVPDAGAMSAGE